MRTLDWIVLTLIVIGAINWGLVGFFQFDLIAMIFGGMHMGISRILYALVGISGLYALTLFGRFSYDGREERHSHNRDI
ncbi:MAG: DUF378 domain-containing protein [Defluviitaleaceae bacterium]|nr:DUF378 domain-containing protein [Defluviitaleaceae bacterium]